MATVKDLSEQRTDDLQLAAKSTNPAGKAHDLAQARALGGQIRQMQRPTNQPATPPVASTGGTTTVPVNPDGTSNTPNRLDSATATQIIDAVLAPWGIDVNATGTMADGSTETLSNYLFNTITTQGLTDPTTIQYMIQSVVPQTPQFNTAFPGWQEAVKNGVVKTPTEYVTMAEGLEAVMTNFGVPSSLINPTTIGNAIAGGTSVNEMTQRLQNGLNAYQNAPSEVQSYFDNEFGTHGPIAAAMLWMTPADQAGGQTYETLSKMLAGAQIGGAAAASNLQISGGLAQRLADMGQNYQSAQAKFAQLTAQAGLYEQTVGEANKTTEPGVGNANQPLSASTTGVEAEFGLSANAEQQVENEALSRKNEFAGGGHASQTQQEGYSGLAAAKSF